MLSPDPALCCLALSQSTLLPACGEKVPEGRMRGKTPVPPASNYKRPSSPASPDLLPVKNGEKGRELCWPSPPRAARGATVGLLPACGEKVPKGRMRGRLTVPPAANSKRHVTAACRRCEFPSTKPSPTPPPPQARSSPARQSPRARDRGSPVKAARASPIRSGATTESEERNCV